MLENFFSTLVSSAKNIKEDFVLSYVARSSLPLTHKVPPPKKNQQHPITVLLCTTSYSQLPLTVSLLYLLLSIPLSLTVSPLYLLLFVPSISHCQCPLSLTVNPFISYCQSSLPLTVSPHYLSLSVPSTSYCQSPLPLTVSTHCLSLSVLSTSYCQSPLPLTVSTHCLSLSVLSISYCQSLLPLTVSPLYLLLSVPTTSHCQSILPLTVSPLYLLLSVPTTSHCQSLLPLTVSPHYLSLSVPSTSHFQSPPLTVSPFYLSLSVLSTSVTNVIAGFKTRRTDKYWRDAHFCRQQEQMCYTPNSTAARRNWRRQIHSYCRLDSQCSTSSDPEEVLYLFLSVPSISYCQSSTSSCQYPLSVYFLLFVPLYFLQSVPTISHCQSPLPLTVSPWYLLLSVPYISLYILLSVLCTSYCHCVSIHLLCKYCTLAIMCC